MKTDPLPTYPSLIVVVVVVVGQSLKKNKRKSETCETCNLSVKRSERKTRPATGRVSPRTPRRPQVCTGVRDRSQPATLCPLSVGRVPTFTGHFNVNTRSSWDKLTSRNTTNTCRRPGSLRPRKVCILTWRLTDTPRNSITSLEYRSYSEWVLHRNRDKNKHK